MVRAASAGSNRERSIVVRLLILTLSILTPLLILTGVLTILYGNAERRVIEAERADVARIAAEIVDRKVAETIAALRVLAASPTAREGDLAAFHRRAMDAAKLHGEAIVLVDRSGQQLVSTRTAFGEPLPRRDDMRPIAGVLAGNQAQVSDVVTGTFIQKPVVLVSVPVLKDDAVAYALSSTIATDALSGILVEAGMKPEWIAGIVDRHGIFIARSRDNETYLGRQARPEVVATATSGEREGTFPNVTLEGVAVANSFRRSKLSGWTVVVAVPNEILQAPLHRALKTVLSLGAILMLVSLALALIAGRRISKPARALANAALALAGGQHRPWRDTQIREFNQVGTAFDRAAQVMRERDAAQAELQRTGALLETIMGSTPDLVYAKDRDSRHILSNAATLAVIGRTWDEVRGRNESDWHGDAREAAAILANDRRVMESNQAIQVEETFTAASGPRTYLSTKAPLHDATGAVIGVVGVSTDISDRKAQEAHAEFIMRELSHRTKNLLTVVQAIAQQTGRKSLSIEEFGKGFEGRLKALASLHDLLIAQDWSGVRINDLLRVQLSPFFDEPGDLDAAGPPLLLAPHAAQTISLALHELATNASKYGAWSVPAGKVTVRWAIENASGGRRFEMTWVESGGPPVTPPNRTGFGSVVLQRMTALAWAQSRLSLEFRPDGVRWSVDVPADAVEAKLAASG